MACLLSSRGWIGTWSLMPVYALNLSSGVTSGEDLMKSARRSGRITGSRVHQHTMALKLETQGGREEGTHGGRSPREKAGCAGPVLSSGLVPPPIPWSFCSVCFQQT